MPHQQSSILIVGPIIAKPMGSNSPFKPLRVSLLEFYSSKNESHWDRGREIKFGPLVYGEVDNLSCSLHHGVLLLSWLVEVVLLCAVLTPRER
jgi:hypothetical protein